VTLPEAELSFHFAAAAQLKPVLRPAFTERVATIFQSHADPGPGDVDRAVRQALIGLWISAQETELRPARWHRVTPGFSGHRNGPDRWSGSLLGLVRSCEMGSLSAKIKFIQMSIEEKNAAAAHSEQGAQLGGRRPPGPRAAVSREPAQSVC
jgi:hypothetical protein